MDLFIVWNYRRSIDCYTVLGARHSRTIMANHTSFCWIMAAVLSKSWRKVLNFWTSHPPSRNIIPLFTSVVLRNPHVPFGSYRLPACRYPSDPSGSLSAEFSAPWTEGQLTGVGRVWGVSQLSYFPKRYIRSWTVSFLGSPHSGTVIAGRARLFLPKHPIKPTSQIS